LEELPALTRLCACAALPSITCVKINNKNINKNKNTNKIKNRERVREEKSRRERENTREERREEKRIQSLLFAVEKDVSE
jgi:hypothetical protein